MSEIPNDVKRLLFWGGSTKQLFWTHMFNFLVANACLIVGIVGDATNKKLGLDPTIWLMIAIGCTIAFFFHWLRAYYAAKEG